ncbi:MAG: hypothetical protein DMG33_16435 [Acidobacteria bacterium]|nr:MAG: hypothetical protein DMG33_16435 [Acidobacteriota bacterium]
MVQRDVGLEVVDGGISRERAEERLQAGPRLHAAVAEDDVLAIGRNAVRQIGGRHIGHQPAENLDGRVERACGGHGGNFRAFRLLRG